MLITLRKLNARILLRVASIKTYLEELPFFLKYSESVFENNHSPQWNKNIPTLFEYCEFQIYMQISLIFPRLCN